MTALRPASRFADVSPGLRRECLRRLAEEVDTYPPGQAERMAALVSDPMPDWQRQWLWYALVDAVGNAREECARMALDELARS